MVTVKTAWIFDVDGVITNFQTRKIEDPQILDEIIKRLEMGEPVAFITGRSHQRILENVLGKLENKINERNILNNLFISMEFGGTQSFYENGQRIDLKNNNFLISHKLSVEIKQIIDREFSDSMFDDPKETLISIEMAKDFPINEYKLLQVKLITKIKDILERYDTENKLEIHKDHIAINIKNKSSNKGYATRQMLEWFSKRGIEPEKYIVFGDNISDKEITDELFKNGKSLEFVFVGNKDDLGDNPQNYKITIKNSEFEKGTLEYLRSNLN